MDNNGQLQGCRQRKPSVPRSEDGHGEGAMEAAGSGPILVDTDRARKWTGWQPRAMDTAEGAVDGDAGLDKLYNAAPPPLHTGTLQLAETFGWVTKLAENDLCDGLPQRQVVDPRRVRLRDASERWTGTSLKALGQSGNIRVDMVSGYEHHAGSGQGLVKSEFELLLTQSSGETPLPSLPWQQAMFPNACLGAAHEPLHRVPGDRHVRRERGKTHLFCRTVSHN